MADAALVQAFEEAMYQIYRRAKTEAKYTPQSSLECSQRMEVWLQHGL